MADLITGGGFRFDTRYTELPSVFYRLGEPEPAPRPELTIVNVSLARELGLRLEELSPDAQAALFSGRSLAEGSKPFSQAYAGHQFGGFTVLGDGRAHVLGEHLTPDGRRVDIQLKGSGRTPFSRGGDGKATLGPMLREYIISEAMVGLGVPTTRSLAVVRTGERVMREEPLPGAVLTRVASSHLRVGTFQLAAALGEPEPLRALLTYAIERHDPDLADAACPALALWDAVAKRQAALIASWMRIGFVHGVMNTDNMTISGETIDYGPCAFMEAYDPETVYSSIDSWGRYAYGNQPSVALWNLARFAEALLPLFDEDTERAIKLAETSLHAFQGRYDSRWTAGMADKLGLPHVPGDVVGGLAGEVLTQLQQNGLDYTSFFRRLAEAARGDAEPVRGEFIDLATFDDWLSRWRALQPDADLMDRANPIYIPRNHLVEEALTAATAGDLAPFEALMAAVGSPFEERAGLERYAEPGQKEFTASFRTFCGT